MGQMPFLSPEQQCHQSIEGNARQWRQTGKIIHQPFTGLKREG